MDVKTILKIYPQQNQANIFHLTTEQILKTENSETCYIVKKNLKKNIWKIKTIAKLEINVIVEGNIEVLRIAYVIAI